MSTSPDPRQLAEDFIAYHEGRGPWPVDTPHMGYSIALARELLSALDALDEARSELRIMTANFETQAIVHYKLLAERDRLAEALRSIAVLTDVADTPQSRRAWLSESVRIARAALASMEGEK